MEVGWINLHHEAKLTNPFQSRISLQTFSQLLWTLYQGKPMIQTMATCEIVIITCRACPTQPPFVVQA